MSGPEQAATVTSGQAAYEELVRRVGSEYDSWGKLPGDLRAAHEAAAQAAIEAAFHAHDDARADYLHLAEERDSLAERIAELRVMLSMLADRAEASGAITEDEADEYRKRGGVEATS